MSAMREPTPSELLEDVGTTTAKVAASKVKRQENSLREARSILSDIIVAYAECFDSKADVNAAGRLGEALEAGRQHIMYCGFREMPSEPFA